MRLIRDIKAILVFAWFPLFAVIAFFLSGCSMFSATHIDAATSQAERTASESAPTTTTTHTIELTVTRGASHADADPNQPSGSSPGPVDPDVGGGPFRGPPK